MTTTFLCTSLVLVTIGTIVGGGILLFFSPFIIVTFALIFFGWIGTIGVFSIFTFLFTSRESRKKKREAKLAEQRNRYNAYTTTLKGEGDLAHLIDDSINPVQESRGSNVSDSDNGSVAIDDGAKTIVVHLESDYSSTDDI